MCRKLKNWRCEGNRPAKRYPQGAARFRSPPAPKPSTGRPFKAGSPEPSNHEHINTMRHIAKDGPCQNESGKCAPRKGRSPFFVEQKHKMCHRMCRDAGRFHWLKYNKKKDQILTVPTQTNYFHNSFIAFKTNINKKISIHKRRRLIKAHVHYSITNCLGTVRVHKY